MRTPLHNSLPLAHAHRRPHRGRDREPRDRLLNCPGVEGKDHLYTAGVCVVVHAACGDFDRLPGTDSASCDHEGPVTVTVDGTCRGREIRWKHTYDFTCARQFATGLVFEFCPPQSPWTASPRDGPGYSPVRRL
ncbi:SSI family serine proteinase inhibitor [Streptomyces sp. NPDC056549]|uniref:SSI family serine proteinase inhibitor n=1 Tax=Streptomyces sp. NPDC056549 TaxID=3345864 RepID=UPI0036C3D72E